ncbi:hypothetical protein K1720_07885 [Thermococcus argininiproducens]|uniref:Lipoprotein n=1 Tax=Thermococcus argininiproducens TaxID=2866384 RepID=A0A9E7M9Z9_9EURY|nr:hypothetical protein [Thermococcus argininiproducens]USG99436.1 hypothetical protein K1720_07885 [Thermococcus argininiproducens]
MKKAFVITFILLVIISFSACVQKEPTPQALIEEIEDVDKYSYSIEYHQETQFSNVTIYSRGGFNYDREEAFWESKVIRKEITYINETILGDFMYFSYAIEKNGNVIQKGSGNTTIQEYFEKLKDNLMPGIETPEDLKYQMLKGADLSRNPLYYLKDILKNTTNFEVARGDGLYLIGFNFTRQYESPMPENVSENLKDYFETIRWIETTRGFARLWVKDNLPIKGEIHATKFIERPGLNMTSTIEISAKFEITYDYKRPEWIKKVIE